MNTYEERRIGTFQIIDKKIDERVVGSVVCSVKDGNFATTQGRMDYNYERAQSMYERLPVLSLLIYAGKIVDLRRILAGDGVYYVRGESILEEHFKMTNYFGRVGSVEKLFVGIPGFVSGCLPSKRWYLEDIGEKDLIPDALCKITFDFNHDFHIDGKKYALDAVQKRLGVEFGGSIRRDSISLGEMRMLEVVCGDKKIYVSGRYLMKLMD